MAEITRDWAQNDNQKLTWRKFNHHSLLTFASIIDTFGNVRSIPTSLTLKHPQKPWLSWSVRSTLQALSNFILSNKCVKKIKEEDFQQSQGLRAWRNTNESDVWLPNEIFETFRNLFIFMNPLQERLLFKITPTNYWGQTKEGGNPIKERAKGTRNSSSDYK